MGKRAKQHGGHLVAKRQQKKNIKKIFKERGFRLIDVKKSMKKSMDVSRNWF